MVSEGPVIKICDFGFARLIESEAPLEMSIVGTPLNMSPEMLQCLPYTIKSDIWSLGTITYEMLCGRVIFEAMNKAKLMKILNLGEYEIPKELHLSTEAIDFISSCIQYNPSNRLPWKELTNHPFISGDTITPFDFAKLMKQNFIGLYEDKGNYRLSSKVQYKFTELYENNKIDNKLEIKDKNENINNYKEEDCKSGNKCDSEEECKSEEYEIEAKNENVEKQISEEQQNAKIKETEEEFTNITNEEEVEVTSEDINKDYVKVYKNVKFENSEFVII